MPIIARIGDVVGVESKRHYTREGAPVCVHYHRRAVEASVIGFHLPTRPVVHLLRAYVVEYPDKHERWRFLWSSLCGGLGVWIEADGRCRGEHLCATVPCLYDLCSRCERIRDESCRRSTSEGRGEA